jgi:predicted metalloprotease with PDZ domain
MIVPGRATQPQAGPPIEYLVTFPEPEHRWLQVEMRVTGLGSQPLRARMSRSSPGRYATHEFAKNVFWVEAFDGRERQLSYTRPDVDEWQVAGHDGTVKFVYKIFGDYPDGTYMGVDTTHAHLNIPATFLWAMGHESRPLRIRFQPPAGVNWTVATQLFPTSDRWTFTAPNFQYFMDSPTELAPFLWNTFTVPRAAGPPATIRLAVHAEATQADVDELATLVERVVREQVAVFGELPVFEPGHYTFLLDYVSWGEGDGMEHRNSTVISSPGLPLGSPQGRRQALGTISHEFFHVWNVERIRPVGLEPFDFTRPNITCCLWLAEGFTQYYGPLLLARAGFGTPPVSAGISIINGSGRTVRSAVQMSEHAPFADAGVSNDAHDRGRTFISYYSYGAALALALDLSLRETSGGRLSLDDYMRRLWIEHGKDGPAPGLVARPYSLRDLRGHLATLTNDRAFADAFFDRYVEGREVPDYARLLQLAGYDLRPAAPDRGWIGSTAVAEQAGGLAIGVSGRGGGGGRPGVVPFNTPLYAAGIDGGDVITTIDGEPATPARWTAISQRRPGATVTLGVRRRDGATVTKTVTLAADPSLRVVPLDQLTPAQQRFRDDWLGTKVR